MFCTGKSDISTDMLPLNPPNIDKCRPILTRLYLFAVFPVGYGHITPVTTSGKLFCIVFCLFGIPICLLTLKTAGELISGLLTGAIIHFERKVLKTQGVRRVEIKCAVLTFASMMVFISISSAVQVIWEKWSFADAFYAWFITFTTVGFGDFIPFESVVSREDGIVTAIFHIFGTLPALCGLCLVASVVNTLFRVFDRDEMQTDSHSCSERSKDCRRKSLNYIENGNLQLAQRDLRIKPSQRSTRSHSM